jgi:hypothetical protein
MDLLYLNSIDNVSAGSRSVPRNPHVGDDSVSRVQYVKTRIMTLTSPKQSSFATPVSFTFPPINNVKSIRLVKCDVPALTNLVASTNSNVPTVQPHSVLITSPQLGRGQFLTNATSAALLNRQNIFCQIELQSSSATTFNSFVGGVVEFSPAETLRELSFSVYCCDGSAITFSGKQSITLVLELTQLVDADRSMLGETAKS